MLRHLLHWRQRMLDLASILVVLIFAGCVWPRFPLNVSAILSALFIWSTGLSLMGHYKMGATPPLNSIAGKLLIDHAMLCIVWLGAQFLFGIKPEISVVLIFGLMSFAGLVMVRLRVTTARWISSESRALIAVDIVLGLVVFCAVNGLWWGLSFPFSLMGAVVIARALSQGAARFLKWPLPAWLASQGLFIVLLCIARPMFQWPQDAAQLVLGAGLLPTLIIGAHRFTRFRRPPLDRQEIWRRVTLLAGMFLLFHPLFSARQMGASDAKLYAEAMQDFLGQIKAGIFPVFVSQTEIAPWGSVFPFRMAFYHFHFGALLDLLALHSLNVYAVQHLTLILSGAGGAFGLYATLKRLAPERAWECAALALLYVACPAWLSAFYGLDMYFTAMTLPWLPLVIYGVMRTFQPDCSLRSYLMLGAALAATWLAHPPVGFWTAVIASLSQLLRLATAGHWPTHRDIAGLTLALSACLLLCAGLFVSLVDVRIPGEMVDPSPQVLNSLRSVIPQVFKPVSSAADRLSDMQLGYAWQVLLLAGVLIWPRHAVRVHWILLVLTLTLIVLIYPLPGITSMLWRALPWEITNITNVWPMQRLYPIVATLAAFIALGVLRATSLTRGKSWQIAALATLCLWSGIEAEKFVRRGTAFTKTPEANRVDSKIENTPLLASWTAYTPHLPPYPLINMVSDPRLRNRLLNAEDKTERVSNYRIATAAFNQPPPGAIIANSARLSAGVQQLTSGFTLEPGQRYQLTLYFSDYDYAGVLLLLPLRDIYYRFYREVYFTPRKHRQPLSLTVWTTEMSPVKVDMLFRPSDPSVADVGRIGFLSYQLTPYHIEDLPIKVTSLAPYTAIIDTNKASFLETHRFFARGYRATVNGRNVPVTESPQHLAMLPLTAGKNEVSLDYIGPPAVRAAFWVSAITWIALAGYGGWLVMQRWLARRPIGGQST